VRVNDTQVFQRLNLAHITKTQIRNTSTIDANKAEAIPTKQFKGIIADLRFVQVNLLESGKRTQEPDARSGDIATV
jgi:hypothetical protein